MNKKICSKLLLFSLCTTSLHAAESTHKLNIYNTAGVSINTVSGAGKAKANVDNGLKVFDSINLQGRGKHKDYKYNYNLGLQITNDESKDPKTLALTNLGAKVSRGANTLKLGDQFENFSQYSLNTGLKGIGYERSKSNTSLIPGVKIIFGYASPRWDSFWSDDIDIKTKERTVTGIHLNQKFFGNTDFGISGVFVKDSDPVTSSDELIDGQAFTFNWKNRPIKGLTIDGEHSFASFDEKVGTATTKNNSAAHKVKAVARGGGTKVKLELERVGTKYRAPVASATPDRQKILSTFNHKHTKEVSGIYSLIYFTDNLDNQKTDTTKTFRPQAKWVKRNLLGRKSAQGSFNYRLTSRNRGSRKQTDHYFAFSHSDTYGNYTLTNNLGYTALKTKASIVDQKEFLVNTSVSTRKTTHGGAYVWRPNIRLGIWNVSDDLALADSYTYELSVGTSLDIPEKKINTNLSIGYMAFDIDRADNSKRLFLRNMNYWTPDFLKKWGKNRLYSKVIFNNFDFSTEANNFSQTSIELGITTRI